MTLLEPRVAYTPEQARDFHGRFGQDGDTTATPELTPAQREAVRGYLATGATSAAVRESATGNEIHGTPLAPDAAAIVAAVDATPPLDTEVYRGIAVHGDPDTVRGMFTVGKPVSIPLGSASLDERTAAKFAQWSRNDDEHDSAENRTEVMFRLLPGGHGLPIDYDRLEMQGLADEREVIVRGDYTVSAVGVAEASDYYEPGTDQRVRIDVTLRPAARAATLADAVEQDGSGRLVLVWSSFAEARESHDTPRQAASSGDHAGSAMVALPAPPQADDLVQPDGEPAGQMHMTLVYLGMIGDDLDPESRDAVEAAVRLAAQQTPVPTVELTHVERFAPSDPGEDQPVVLVDDGPALPALRALLEDWLRVAGVDWPDLHPFRAHLTLGYYQPGDGPDMGCLDEPVVYEPAGLCVHWGDDVTTYPFAVAEVAAVNLPGPRPPAARTAYSETQARDFHGRFGDSTPEGARNAKALDRAFLDTVGNPERVDSERNVARQKADSAATVAEHMNLPDGMLDQPAADTLASTRLDDALGELSAASIGTGVVDVQTPTLRDAAEFIDLTHAAGLAAAEGNWGAIDRANEAIGRLSDQAPEGGAVALGDVNRALAGALGVTPCAECGVAAMYTDQWANSAGDSDTGAVAMQIIAADRYGGSSDQAEGYLHSQSYGQVAEAQGIAEREGPLMRAYLDASHDASSAWLADHGLAGQLTLYRGVHGDFPDLEQASASTDPVHVETNPLSSWTTSYGTATDFAGQGSYRGDEGYVLTTTITADQVVGTPFSGAGCLPEREVVVAPGARGLDATVDQVQRP